MEYQWNQLIFLTVMETTLSLMVPNNVHQSLIDPTTSNVPVESQGDLISRSVLEVNRRTNLRQVTLKVQPFLFPSPLPKGIPLKGYVRWFYNVH